MKNLAQIEFNRNLIKNFNQYSPMQSHRIENQKKSKMKTFNLYTVRASPVAKEQQKEIDNQKERIKLLNAFATPLRFRKDTQSMNKINFINNIFSQTSLIDPDLSANKKTEYPEKNFK